jgi:hypothetical protein
MNESSRVGPASRARAVALLVGVLVLVAWGVAAGSTAPTTAERPLGSSDEALYRAVNDRMADGVGYYAAAVALQQERGFPTAPAVVVRTPLLAETVDLLGTTGARALLAVLLIGAIPVWFQRFAEMARHRAEQWAAVAILTLAALPYVTPFGVWCHEAWALALVLLSLGLRTDRRRVLPIALGVLAPFYRELALVYPMVMAIMAVRDGRRREAAAWSAGILAFVGFYLWHVHQVAVAQVPDPPRSQGWLDVGGWPFIVDTMRYGSFLGLVPFPVVAVLTPLALAGWCFVRSPAATRSALTAVVFIGCFMVIGRPENNYWGTLYATLLLPGLAFVPRGCSQLWRSLRPRSTVHI